MEPNMPMTIFVCGIFFWLAVIIASVSPLPGLFGDRHRAVLLALIGIGGIVASFIAVAILVAMAFDPNVSSLFPLTLAHLALTPSILNQTFHLFSIGFDTMQSITFLAGAGAFLIGLLQLRFG